MNTLELTRLTEKKGKNKMNKKIMQMLNELIMELASMVAETEIYRCKGHEKNENCDGCTHFRFCDLYRKIKKELLK